MKTYWQNVCRVGDESRIGSRYRRSAVGNAVSTQSLGVQEEVAVRGIASSRLVVMLACALLLCSVSRVQAQSCDALLHQGIYNTSSSASLTEKTASYLNWFCQQEFSSQSEAESYGASLGFPLEGIPINFGASASSSNWSQWYSSFCSQVATDETFRQSLSSYVQTIDQGLIQAFNNCVSANGLHVWLEYGSSPNTFAFVAVYRSPGAPPYVKLTDFQATSNVVCDGLASGRQKLKLTGSTYRTLCSRKDNAAVTIVVNATVDPMGGGSLTLPPVAVPSISTAVRKNLYTGALMMGFLPPADSNARIVCAMTNLDELVGVDANIKLYDSAGTVLEAFGAVGIAPGATVPLYSRPMPLLGAGGPFRCSFFPANGTTNVRGTISAVDASTGLPLAGPLEAREAR